MSFIKGVGALLLLIALATATVERLWWVHWQSSYPSWLIRQTPPEASNVIDLRRLCDEPLEVMASGDQHALVRCGSFWPFSTVWLTSRDFVSPAFSSGLSR